MSKLWHINIKYYLFEYVKTSIDLYKKIVYNIFTSFKFVPNLTFFYIRSCTMTPTSESSFHESSLRQFVGSQVEIRCSSAGSIKRGQIASVFVAADPVKKTRTLVILFDWLAEWSGGKWRQLTKKKQEFNLNWCQQTEKLREGFVTLDFLRSRAHLNFYLPGHRSNIGLAQVVSSPEPQVA